MTEQLSAFGPDFPFAYDDWLRHPAGLGRIPDTARGTEVAIVGAGLAGIIAAYELMKLGFKPVLYEQGRLGGRLRSHFFQSADGIVAELGGMRFPTSSRGFYHYLDLVGLKTRPFPNPLDPASPSTVIDLEGEIAYIEHEADKPPVLREVEQAWQVALEDGAQFSALSASIRARDVAKIKAIWDALVPLWDGRTFYDFIATAPSFQRLSFRHREVFRPGGLWHRRPRLPVTRLGARRSARGRDDLEARQRLVIDGAESSRAACRTADGGRVAARARFIANGPRPGIVRLSHASKDRVRE